MSHEQDKPPTPPPSHPTQQPDPPLEVLGNLYGCPARVYEVTANGEHRVVVEIDLHESRGDRRDTAAIKILARRVRAGLRMIWTAGVHAGLGLPKLALRPTETEQFAEPFTTMTFQYKCRRCGGYAKGCTGNPQMVGRYLIDIAVSGEAKNSRDAFAQMAHLPTTHQCPDGGTGLADLVGASPTP